MSSAEHPDALTTGPVRGRGAGLNPGNRFEDFGRGVRRLHVLGNHLDAMHAEHPRGRQVVTRVFEDASRGIVNRVDSPDLPFNWTMNPYRGCEHGCVYCYARPTHEMLGFSCGLDFETKIMVKRDAPTLLRTALASPRWKGEPIAMSGVTDAYQPLERTYGVTRECVRLMSACRQPVCIVTKNRLVTRDIDLLAPLAAVGATRVAMSVTTLDNDLARRMEPRASAPGERLQAIRELTDAGIPVTVLVAPIIPGLTDHETPRLLEAAADAAATCVGWVLLRLPHQVKALFLDWLRTHYPDRAGRVERAVRDTRDGALTSNRFGERQRGSGALADQIAQTVSVFARRHGLATDRPPLSSASFRRPPTDQLELFEAAE